MKFYFCESCGVRITEADIDDGLARNKKLKGVFCRECAIGVTTMETLPLTNKEARETLDKAEPQPPRPQSRSRRRSGAAALPTKASGQQVSSRSSARVLARPVHRTRSHVLIVGAGVALVALVLLVVLANRTSKQPAAPDHVAQDKARQERVQPTTKPAAAPRATPADDKPAPPPSESREAANTPLQSLEKELSNLDSRDRSGRKALIEAFIERHGEDALSPGLKEQLALWRAASAAPGSGAGDTSTKKPSPDVIKEPVEVEEPKPEGPRSGDDQTTPPAPVLPGPRPHEVAFSAGLDGLLAALAAWEIDKAEAMAQRMAADPKLGNLQPAAECLPQAVSVLKAEAAARRVALEKLVGETIRLRTRKRTLKGKFEGLEGQALRLRSQYFIDGKPRLGKPFTVLLKDVPGPELARLLRIPKPRTPEAWVARAMRELAAQRPESAEVALEKCRDAGLAVEPCLRRRLEEQKKGIAEVAAERFWTDFEKRPRKGLGRGPARQLLKRLVAFQKESGNTAYARERAVEIEEARRELQQAAYGAEVVLTKDVEPPAPLGTISPTGTGTPEDPYVYRLTSSRGLDLAGFRVHATRGQSFTLDLGGGDLRGAGKPGLQTGGNPQPPGPGGGCVVIQNVGTVSMGGIEALVTLGRHKPESPCSDIRIGDPQKRTGPVRVGYIQTRNPRRWCGHIGAVKIFGSGDVRIEGDDGEPGDISTWGERNTGKSGSIRVDHDGAFTARFLDASGRGKSDFPQANDISLNGNGDGKGRPAGDLSVVEIRAFCTPVRSGRQSGHVTVKGYANVSVGKLLTFNRAREAGSVSITDIHGDVKIGGEIDLSGKNGQNGKLTIATTGKGSITLAELDLKKVGQVKLSAGSGRIHVTGALRNFDTAQAAAQRQLVAAAGQRISYRFKAGELNDYLGGKTYTLPSGGVLHPGPAP